MIESIDPYWLEGTKPAWVITAMVYIGSAIHLRFFMGRSVKARYWGSFFAIGAAIFLLVNRRQLVDSDTLILSIEVLSIVILVFVWLVFFNLVRNSSE